MGMLVFRQLFDAATSTYSYIVGDQASGEGVLIDPVLEQVDRDMELLEQLGLSLTYTFETHVHADHVTGSGRLRRELNSQSVVAKDGGAPCADVSVAHGDHVKCGALDFEVRATPGHTGGCISYVLAEHGMAFTGDALLIRGCGRTDFQEGNAEQLYDSVHGQLLSLPDDTLFYPGHDYKGRTVTTVAEERAYNPRLGGGRTRAEFVKIMDELQLAKPKLIDIAVPANLRCGVSPSELVTGEAPPEQGWAPLSFPGGIPTVEPDWVAAHCESVRIVDVREPDEYEGELGHIEGAELVPLATVGQAAQGWDRSAKLVVVCRSGRRSGNATRQLVAMGFEQVANVAGGMLLWRERGL